MSEWRSGGEGGEGRTNRGKNESEGTIDLEFKGILDSNGSAHARGQNRSTSLAMHCM